jgi:hypothetical protein
VYFEPRSVLRCVTGSESVDELLAVGRDPLVGVSTGRSESIEFELDALHVGAVAVDVGLLRGDGLLEVLALRSCAPAELVRLPTELAGALLLLARVPVVLPVLVF